MCWKVFLTVATIYVLDQSGSTLVHLHISAYTCIIIMYYMCIYSCVIHSTWDWAATQLRPPAARWSTHCFSVRTIRDLNKLRFRGVCAGGKWVGKLESRNSPSSIHLANAKDRDRKQQKTVCFSLQRAKNIAVHMENPSFQDHIVGGYAWNHWFSISLVVGDFSAWAGEASQDPSLPSSVTPDFRHLGIEPSECQAWGQPWTNPKRLFNWVPLKYQMITIWRVPLFHPLSTFSSVFAWSACVCMCRVRGCPSFVECADLDWTPLPDPRCGMSAQVQVELLQQPGRERQGLGTQFPCLSTMLGSVFYFLHHLVEILVSMPVERCEWPVLDHPCSQLHSSCRGVPILGLCQLRFQHSRWHPTGSAVPKQSARFSHSHLENLWGRQNKDVRWNIECWIKMLNQKDLIKETGSISLVAALGCVPISSEMQCAAWPGGALYIYGRLDDANPGLYEPSLEKWAGCPQERCPLVAAVTWTWTT